MTGNGRDPAPTYDFLHVVVDSLDVVGILHVVGGRPPDRRGGSAKGGGLPTDRPAGEVVL